MLTTRTIKSQNKLVVKNTVTTAASPHRTGSKIQSTITNYQKQLFIIFVLIIIWGLYMYAQYQYYYSSATIAAVNRLIRHEALRLEQQREEQQQQQNLPPRSTVGEQQLDLPLLSSPNTMRKVSPQQLLRGSSKVYQPVLPR